MEITMTLGPEKATIIERFLTIFDIPFYLGCLIFIFIFGPSGAILSAYLQTNDFYDALIRTFYLFFGIQLSLWQGVAGLSLLFVILFYFLYMIRYMRLKLVESEQLLTSIFPEGEETYHRVFGSVSLIIPPVIIDIILIYFFFLQTVPKIPINFVIFCSEPITLLYLVISFPIWFLMFGTFAWVYFSSIRGLHELGKISLKLKPLYGDRMLGLRPIGSLSLSFSFTYFVGLGLLILVSILVWPNPSPTEYILLLLVLTMLGVIFFFLPLNTIHKRMLELKQKELDALRKEFLIAIEKLTELRTQVSESSISDLREILIGQTTVLIFNVKKEEVLTMPTWPFDTQILGRLSAIIFSVIAIILANIIMRYINI